MKGISKINLRSIHSYKIIALLEDSKEPMSKIGMQKVTRTCMSNLDRGVAELKKYNLLKIEYIGRSNQIFYSLRTIETPVRVPQNETP